MNLHQWAPLQVHVKQYECPVDIEDPLSESRLAPVKSKYLLAKLMFCSGFRWVRIQLGNVAARITLNWIRFQLFTVMRIRILILLFIKARRVCDHWSLDTPGLYFQPPGLHCKYSQPSEALFCASKSEFRFFYGFGSSFSF